MWISKSPILVKQLVYKRLPFQKVFDENSIVDMGLFRFRTQYNFVSNDVREPILHECSFSGEMMWRTFMKLIAKNYIARVGNTALLFGLMYRIGWK